MQTTPPREMGRGGFLYLLLISSSIIMILGIGQLGAAYGQEATVEVTIDAQPRMTSILVDNVIYLPSQLPVKFSWNPYSSHTVTIPSGSSYEGTTKRYDFVQWNDLSPSLSRTIEAKEDMAVKNFIAIFKTKYLLTIYSDYGSPAGAGWYEEGATAELSIAQSEAHIETVPGKVREAFMGWSTGYKPTSLKNYVDIIGPTVVLANWKEQYMLGIASAVTPGSGSGWYDNGAVARASVPATVEFSDLGKKYSFKEWQVLGESDQAISDKTLQSTDVLMDGPHTLAPQWNELYYVDVDSNIGNPSGEDYYAQGDTATITIDPIYETEPGKVRFILSGWDGIQLDAPTSNSFQIKVNEPVMLKPVWTKQYFVKVNSVYGMVEGSGWYDEGSPANLKLQTWAIDTGLGKKAEFMGWSSDADTRIAASSQANEYTIDAVRGPSEIIVMWRSDDAGQLALIVSALAAVAVTAAFTIIFNMKKRRNAPQDKGMAYNRRVGF